MTAPKPETIDDEAPVTLEEACTIVFRGLIKPSTLRAEAARGRLDVRRIGRRDFTTLRSARELMTCQDEKRRRVFISTKNESNGSSETDKASSAQAALSQKLRLLKGSLKNT